MTKFCTQCGSELPPQARFCPECGHAAAPPDVPGPDRGRERSKGAPPARRGRQAAPAQPVSWFGPWRYPMLIVLGATIGVLLYIGSLNRGPRSPASGESVSPLLMQQIQAAQRQLLERPDDLQLLEQLGHLYYDAREFEGAIAYYRRILEERPESPEIRTNMGAALDALGRFPEAREAFLQVLEYAPTFDRAIYNLGIVAEHMNDLPEARRWYNRVLEVSPQGPMASPAQARLQAIGPGQ